MEKSGKKHVAKYFVEGVDRNGVAKYDFNGLYWQDKENQDWSRLDQIF